jgi:hypothetical protein
MSDIEVFCQARQYLVESIEPTIECFLTGLWDPCIKFILMRETAEIIDKDLRVNFPELDEKFLPKVKFRMHDEEEVTEVSIQNFFNSDNLLTYLGSAGVGGHVFDLYFRNSFDPRIDYMFVSKYGHGPDEYYSGSKTAEAEYNMGAVTPLSVAYQMAIEDGVI